MRTTAEAMLAQIAPNVQDSGVCITNPEGLADAIVALNLACRALHSRIDDEGTLWEWTVPTFDNCFALPEDCLEGRQMWINGTTATQHDQWYQGKLACGLNDPGSMRYGPEIIDLGNKATPTPLPRIRGIRLGWMAQSDADAGKLVDFIVTNEYGEQKREVVTLLPKQELVKSTNVAYDLAWVKKERMVDNLKLYQCYDNGQSFPVCDYLPQTILGAFRRKKIPQCYSGCKYIQIKGKARYTPIELPTDICPFDDPIALSWAVSAIADMRRKDGAAYAEHLLLALNEIFKGMKDQDSASNVAQARFRSGFGPNPSQAGNNPQPGTSLYLGRGAGFGYGGYW